MPGNLILAATILLAGSVIYYLAFVVAEEDENRYKENRSLWEETSSNYYTFVYVYRCSCKAHLGGPVKVSVRNNSFITSIQNVSDGEYPEGYFGDPVFYTIDELFDQVRRAIRSADEFEVEYDNAFGYPIRVSVDYSENTVHDEYGFEAYEYLPHRDPSQ